MRLKIQLNYSLDCLKLWKTLNYVNTIYYTLMTLSLAPPLYIMGTFHLNSATWIVLLPTWWGGGCCTLPCNCSPAPCIIDYNLLILNSILEYKPTQCTMVHFTIHWILLFSKNGQIMIETHLILNWTSVKNLFRKIWADTVQWGELLFRQSWFYVLNGIFSQYCFTT